MATFELNPTSEESVEKTTRDHREECLISLKVYDSCKIQTCLGYEEVGSSRAAENVCIGDRNISEGDVIIAPDNAVIVQTDKMRVKKTIISKKAPSPFKQGFWDIDLKYVFEYELTFKEAGGDTIEPRNIKAYSVFNKKLTLHGAPATDIVISTDLFARHGDDATFESDPYVLVEAKAVSLSTDVANKHRHDGECIVSVTIGLFTIIKLFRIVQLLVETAGFCIPKECPEPPKPCNPCEFFANMDFPIDIFVPDTK